MGDLKLVREAFGARTSGLVFELSALAACQRCRKPFITTLLLGSGFGAKNRGGPVTEVEAVEVVCAPCRAGGRA